MQTHKGFIALTSVLVLSAIFLSVSISIASRAISVLSSEVAYMERDASLYSAEACAEHALMEVQRTLNYAGDESILIGDGSCEVLSVEDTDEGTVIRTESTVGEHTYELQLILEERSQDAAVTQWNRQ